MHTWPPRYNNNNLANSRVEHHNLKKLTFILLHTCPPRYHYNVANSRVEQHVEKGNDDGLAISSVGCCQELWALIMDAGTGFTAQVYNLTPHFLPKVSTLPYYS